MMNSIMEIRSYLPCRFSVKSMLLRSIALLIALVCAGVIGSMQETLFIKELLMTAFVIALLMVVMLSIMLPFQLCFGPEKARIALLAGIGIVSVLGVLVVKGASVCVL